MASLRFKHKVSIGLLAGAVAGVLLMFRPLSDNLAGSLSTMPVARPLVQAFKVAPFIEKEETSHSHGVHSLAESSLAGSSVDAVKVETRNGQVVLNGGVLFYFDYFLSLQGEMPLARIMELVHEDMQANFAADVAGQLYAVFERYVAYLQTIDKRLDALTYESAKAQGITAVSLANEVRADFFSAEEIDTLFDDYDRMLTFTSRASTFEEKMHALERTDEQYNQAMATELFGVEAAIRFQALQQRRAQWQQRLADYRAEKQVIEQSSSLVAADKQKAINALLQRSFDVHEQVRVKTLDNQG